MYRRRTGDAEAREAKAYSLDSTRCANGEGAPLILSRRARRKLFRVLAKGSAVHLNVATGDPKAMSAFGCGLTAGRRRAPAASTST